MEEEIFSFTWEVLSCSAVLFLYRDFGNKQQPACRAFSLVLLMALPAPWSSCRDVGGCDWCAVPAAPQSADHNVTWMLCRSVVLHFNSLTLEWKWACSQSSHATGKAYYRKATKSRGKLLPTFSTGVTRFGESAHFGQVPRLLFGVHPKWDCIELSSPQMG